MQEIADEAEIAKGTLYLYFNDREALLTRAFENVLDELGRRMQEAFSADVDLEQKLRLVVRTQLSFFDENVGFFRPFLASAQYCGEKRPRTHHPRWRAHIERLAALLSSTVEMPSNETQRLAAFIAEGVRGIISLRLEEKHSPELDADVELIVSTVLYGIRRKGKSN